ncbi:phage tail assembly protein [uncultured Croceicoccus sp.]|uniref:phage tail assembly protein n=1 Tax=uncultured Croceicoccus sp. TaxID=1295329 RepID=UPI00262A00C8|nr:phage tail assembly protein [uncultured Croceicoccus sp.]
MTDTPAPAASVPQTADVALATPITRGDTTIERITLRKPKAGALRGLTMQDILQADVSALITLIPRISNPALTAEEAAELEADDFAEIGGTVFGFFMTPRQKAQIEKLTGTTSTN